MSKQLEGSQQRCAALQNANKGLSAQLKALSATAKALGRDYKAHKTQARAELQEMGASLMTQYKPVLIGKLKVGMY